MLEKNAKKFWEAPFVFSFEAVVTGVVKEQDRIGLVFEETYFYPEGGGQPCDRGFIASCPVIDVQETDDVIIHYVSLDSEKKFSAGKSVLCEIDKEYRIHNMRLHTGCHLLFGAARKLFPEVKYAGFNIGEIGNLYLETNQQIRSGDLNKLSLMANRLVIEDRPIKAYLVDKENVKDIEGLAFNIELPQGKVRIVEIENWDTAACSGTHMLRTIDIGPIKVLAREIHKKNVTRIDYAVGDFAVSKIAMEEKILLETSEFLSTSKDQLYEVVHKMSNDLKNTQKDVRKMRVKLVDYKLQELEEGGEIINEIRLVVDMMEYIDSASAKALVSKILSKSNSTIAVIIGGGEESTIVAGCGRDIEIAISQTIIEIAKRFGGGGGGKPTFVSAGGIKADIGTVYRYVEKGLRQLILEQ